MYEPLFVGAFINVRRSYWGQHCALQDKNSRRAAALGATVETMLDSYNNATARDGLHVRDSLGNPLDLNALSRDVIRPVLGAHGLEWKK